MTVNIKQQLVYLDKENLTLILNCPICGKQIWFDITLFSKTLIARSMPDGPWLEDIR